MTAVHDSWRVNNWMGYEANEGGVWRFFVQLVFTSFVCYLEQLGATAALANSDGNGTARMVWHKRAHVVSFIVDSVQPRARRGLILRGL